MDGNVQSRLVGVEDVLAQLVQWCHEDAGAARLIDVGLEHLRRARAEAAVDEALQSADTDPVVAEPRHDAEPRQLPPLRQRPAQVDAQSELSRPGKLLTETEQLSLRAEVDAI